MVRESVSFDRFLRGDICGMRRLWRSHELWRYLNKPDIFVGLEPYLYRISIFFSRQPGSADLLLWRMAIATPPTKYQPNPIWRPLPSPPLTHLPARPPSHQPQIPQASSGRGFIITALRVSGERLLRSIMYSPANDARRRYRGRIALPLDLKTAQNRPIRPKKWPSV